MQQHSSVTIRVKIAAVTEIHFYEFLYCVLNKQDISLILAAERDFLFFRKVFFTKC